MHMFYIVAAKYQIALSKAEVKVDRPIKALSMNIQKPYKWKIVEVLILSKIFFFYIIYSEKQLKDISIQFHL